MAIVDKGYELLSVGDVAKRIGVSTQTIYNYIQEGRWETITFRRGKYKGLLVAYPKERQE